MSFCVDDDTLVFECRKLWNAEKGEELQTFQHNHIVKSVDFNKDGTQLLTGSNEKLLRVFDLGKPDAGRKDPHGCTVLNVLSFDWGWEPQVTRGLRRESQSKGPPGKQITA